MPRISFDRLPDDARLWVFPVAEPLTSDQERTLLERVDRFLDQWRAHGVPLTAGRDWVEERLLLVAVDRASEPPSGCSIDALMGTLKDFERETGCGLTDHAAVLYRDADGVIRSASRATFRALAREGTVSPETRVFDTTLTELGAARGGGLEVAARDAWHGRAFFQEKSAASG